MDAQPGLPRLDYYLGMKQRSAIRLKTVCMLTALALFGQQYPKRYTERITIAGASRHGEIVGEAAHTQFSLGGGPGFTNNGVPQVTGWIVEDWLKKLPEPPVALTRYVVTYHITAFKDSVRERREQYVAYYTYDPAAKRGYVRLPAKGEEHYAENVQMLFRGAAFEGPWFAATPAWAAAANAALQASPTQPGR